MQGDRGLRRKKKGRRKIVKNLEETDINDLYSLSIPSDKFKDSSFHGGRMQLEMRMQSSVAGMAKY